MGQNMIRNLKSSLLLVAGIIIFTPLYICAQDYIWATNHGGIYNDGSFEGVPTPDNGYAILGSSYSYGAGLYDVYLIKLGSAGNVIWSKTYGGAETDQGYSIDNTDDGGFILAGSTRSFGSGARDVYLIRTDDAGNILWSKSFGGVLDDQARSVRVTSDNGFIICGTTDSYGQGYSDLYLIKTDSLGDTIWTRAYGGAGGESGSAVRETMDGGFIAIGSTGSFGEGYSSVYVVRVDADGDSLWAYAYGGAKADNGYTVELSGDGGFLLAGGTASFGAGYTDGYLIKIDANGNVAWEKTYGGAMDDRIYSICLALDGTIMLTGSTDSFGAGKGDIYMVKTNPVGNPILTRTYGGSKTDYGRMIFQEASTNYILVGESYSYSVGGSDVYVIKLDGAATPIYEDDPDLLPSDYELAQNYPNPFNLSTNIEYVLPRHSSVSLTIFNILGQVVHEWNFEFQQAGAHVIRWEGDDNNGRETASGIYFYRLSAGEFSETKKMALIK
ncbi:MAG: T9SS type A sorting domain-containing protein [Candidatus Zixiibacteriota bacterium]